MSAHDDYFDVKDGFERWERAYVRWGKRADDDARDGATTKKGREAEERARRAAKFYMKACDYLARMAKNARDGMVSRGWALPKDAKLCGKDEDGRPCTEPALPKIKGLESVYTGFCDEHDREELRRQLAAYDRAVTRAVTTPSILRDPGS